MEATWKEHNAYQGMVLCTVGLAVASAIALGVFSLLQTDEERAPQEEDTTAYLLSGANGQALREAIKRRGRGHYVAYNPLNA